MREKKSGSPTGLPLSGSSESFQRLCVVVGIDAVISDLLELIPGGALNSEFRVRLAVSIGELARRCGFVDPADRRKDFGQDALVEFAEIWVCDADLIHFLVPRFVFDYGSMIRRFGGFVKHFFSLVERFFVFVWQWGGIGIGTVTA